MRQNMDMGQIARDWRLSAVLVLAAGLALTACEGSTTSAARPPEASPASSLMVTPPSGAGNQPASTEIGAALPDGRISGVTMTDEAGRPIAGTVRGDGTSWVPAQPLAYRTTYRATVSAVDARGTPTTASTNFTTMPDPGGDPIVSALRLQGGGVYGVGMPIALEFNAPIPPGARADVQRRLFVHSDPPQTGVWHWYGDQQVLYRPKDYWRPGTKLTVHTALGGLSVGGRRYLDTDRGVAATIADKLVLRISNTTKQMQVLRNDQLVKTFPVSLGKPTTPSSSGNMVIMTREASAVWVYSDQDRLNVNYAERLTGDGEYIHAAPWSVADQGHNNVSHGCTNLSNDNAAWVYTNSHIGDPVIVTDTEAHVKPGNGWTVWDMSWPDYLKGSVLPH
jgi:lipoprotein-anchoring transpeptidase ErfK/SrfK